MSTSNKTDLESEGLVISGSGVVDRIGNLSTGVPEGSTIPLLSAITNVLFLTVAIPGVSRRVILSAPRSHTNSVLTLLGDRFELVNGITSIRLVSSDAI